jgi:predicted hotdog family 3-hydroxylacyl-ACP dehydratase
MAFPPPVDLLPHRPPMLLLRAVLTHDSGATTCEASFDRIFLSACRGTVPAAFALEMIAQAAAVHHALNALAAGGEHVRATRGLLLGSRRLRFACASLPVDDPLRVHVEGGAEPPGPGGLIRFVGRVETMAGELLASGDATVLESRPEMALA